MAFIRFGLITILTLFLASCGFEPLYAPTTKDGTISLRNVSLSSVVGSESVREYVETAFRQRTNADAAGAEYDLLVSAEESAAQLAVQIDSTVTRFNYQIRADYTLVHRTTGQRVTGRSLARSSFNIVDSPYSTLYAENTARRKAADSLAQQVERDILVKLSQLEKIKSPNWRHWKKSPSSISRWTTTIF